MLHADLKYEFGSDGVCLFNVPVNPAIGLLLEVPIIGAHIHAILQDVRVSPLSEY